jgi:hypothetical protein
LETLSPEQLSGIKQHKKKDEKKQARREGRYHEAGTTKECFRCTVHGFNNSNRCMPVPDKEMPILNMFAGKKYKPVVLKTRPVYAEVPEKYRIKREITGDPLVELPELPTKPGEFTPTRRYTQEHKEGIDKIHKEPFLWPKERKLMHEFMCAHNDVFTWDDSEWGLWHHDFFSPVEFLTIEHKVWVEWSILIPRGQLEEF